MHVCCSWCSQIWKESCQFSFSSLSFQLGATCQNWRKSCLAWFSRLQVSLLRNLCTTLQILHTFTCLQKKQNITSRCCLWIETKCLWLGESQMLSRSCFFLFGTAQLERDVFGCSNKARRVCAHYKKTYN
jgi:hypothetical protein